MSNLAVKYFLPTARSRGDSYIIAHLSWRRTVLIFCSSLPDRGPPDEAAARRGRPRAAQGRPAARAGGPGAPGEGGEGATAAALAQTLQQRRDVQGQACRQVGTSSCFQRPLPTPSRHRRPQNTNFRTLKLTDGRKIFIQTSRNTDYCKTAPLRTQKQREEEQLGRS